jgi:hypothetical protein
MTLPAGHQLLASEMTALVNPVRYGFSARRVANQSINSAALTAISWDIVDRDNSPSFLTVTTTTATIPADGAGIYAVTAKQLLSANTTGRTFMEINVTSSLTGLTTDYRLPTPVNAEGGRIVVSIAVPFAAADTFVVNTFQTSAGALNLTGLLTCYRVSP